VDLHAAKPSSINSRVTDLGNGAWRKQRLGVYLHWVLPPFYRSGVGTAVENNVNNPQANNDTTKEQVRSLFFSLEDVYEPKRQNAD